MYDAKRGVVKWKSDLLFALGSDVVKENAKQSLNGFAQIMNSPAAANFEVLVVGHTDNTRIGKPSTLEQHPTNWHLSTHRAIAVGRVLQNDGLTPDKIGVMGFGEYRPVASNATEAGRSQNRRVEVYVVPEGSIAGGMVPPANTVAAQSKPDATSTAMSDDTIK